MTIYQLAERYNVSVGCIGNWRSKGWMPPGFLLGGRRYWLVETITAWEEAGYPRNWEPNCE